MSNKVYNDLAEEAAMLRTIVSAQRNTWDTKIKAVTCFGEVVEKVANSKGPNKEWWAGRLVMISPIFDLIDSLSSQLGELELVNDYLIDLNQKLQQRVKEDEALIDKLLNEKM